MQNDNHPGPSDIEFLLNGTRVRAEGFPPQTTLLDFVRSRGLTGAKEGCAEGECGACAVAMVRPNGEGSQYTAVNSCLMFLPMAAGQEVYTVESLARGGELAEVQRAMSAGGGSQCGYCTPGLVMSLFAECYRPGREGACDPAALAGNLCRCTGYRPIRDAALSIGPAGRDVFSERLERCAPERGELDYEWHAERFSRPASLTECFKLLRENPAARLVAGGTDLGIESNLRRKRFGHLVSIEGLEELRRFDEDERVVELGAGLVLSEIGGRWTGAPLIFKEWLELFASPLIRNRATLGGNLATASPIGDAAPMLLALDARVKISGERGERVCPLAEFFLDYRKTVLRAGEVLISILIPKPFPMHARFFKAAKRRVDDISTVSAGLSIDLDSNGRVSRARFAYGGVGATPVRVTAAEDTLVGAQWTLEAAERARGIVIETLRPISDHRGSAEYRSALAGNLLEKFWWEQRAEVSA